MRMCLLCGAVTGTDRDKCPKCGESSWSKEFGKGHYTTLEECREDVENAANNAANKTKSELN